MEPLTKEEAQAVIDDFHYKLMSKASSEPPGEQDAVTLADTIYLLERQRDLCERDMEEAKAKMWVYNEVLGLLGKVK